MSTRRLITERDVREAARSGKGIALRPGTIITPAAADLARQLGVSLDSPATAAVAPHAAGALSNRIAIGADHGGFKLKEALKAPLAELEMEVIDVGCNSIEAVDYPVFAARVAERVAAGEARLGIMVDGAGIGSAMVANKIPGVRAALCYDLTTAKNAREHNNANVLTLGGGLIGERLATEIVKTFIQTPFGGDRHARRVAMIDALDQ